MTTKTSNFDKLPALTPQEVVKSRKYLEMPDALDYLGKPTVWFNRLRAAGIVEPDAKLITGQRGHPPLLYRVEQLARIRKEYVEK